MREGVRDGARSYRKSYGRKAWRIDEIFRGMKGNTNKKDCAYVFVVSDNKGNILAMHVSLTSDSGGVEEGISSPTRQSSLVRPSR